VDMARVDRIYRSLLVRRWLTYEPLFWACVPASRGTNRFAASLHRHGGYVCDRNTLLPPSDVVRDWEGDHNNRYFALNPAAYARHNTYEVRMQAGIASPNRACEWAYIVGRTMSMLVNQLDHANEIDMLRRMTTANRWTIDELWAMFQENHRDDVLHTLMRDFSRRYSRVAKPLHLLSLRDYGSESMAQNGARNRAYLIPRGYRLV